MSKDPAVLFYTSDFISGTITMTDEQRGKYILLLCIQHQKGYLTEKDMMNICKIYDIDIWEKFVKDGDLFYNVRMRVESEKRTKYAESRRNNRTKKETIETDMNNICESYVPHMENENENINTIDNSLDNSNNNKINNIKTWKNDFNIYLDELNFIYDNLILDREFIRQQEEFNPNIDILLSLKKAYTNYWATQEGWKHKKKQKAATINWKTTLTNAIGMNKVYKPKEQIAFKQKGTSISDVKEIMRKATEKYNNQNGNFEDKEPFAISENGGYE